MKFMVRQTLEEVNDQRSWEFWLPGEFSEEEQGQKQLQKQKQMKNMLITHKKQRCTQ
ncbi:hypothetical protein LEMLEM_LOCUS19931, partial [Lemmus lemmus]